MKLAQVFREMVDQDKINAHCGFMVFSGTMAGKTGKNGMPVKVAGLCCQEYNHEYEMEEIDVDLLSCVAVAIVDVEGIETLGQLKAAVSRVQGEDSKRIISTLDTLDDTGFKLYRWTDSNLLDVNVGLIVSKNAEVELAGGFEFCRPDGLEELCDNMTLCRSIA